MQQQCYSHYSSMQVWQQKHIVTTYALQSSAEPTLAHIAKLLQLPALCYRQHHKHHKTNSNKTTFKHASTQVRSLVVNTAVPNVMFVFGRTAAENYSISILRKKKKTIQIVWIWIL